MAAVALAARHSSSSAHDVRLGIGTLSEATDHTRR
jgi:hypothetical protein